MPIPDVPDDIFIDSNGCLTERTTLAGEPAIVHYDDIPPTDITIHRGIRCTTPLRTCIDIAPDVTHDHLVQIVQDCLRRRMFTVAEARARLAEPDMWDRPGALLLGAVLPRI